MNRWLLCLLLLAGIATAQSGRIYTPPDPAATGGIEGTMPAGELTHALAIDQERLHVYRATLDAGSNRFRFEHLPVGKYDLVLVTKERVVYEGLRLGDDISSLSSESRAHLEKRIMAADEFFNRAKIHRCGVEGERVLAFVERIRDRKIYQQSGETLNTNLRRLEVIELAQAADDWQMTESRHLYREGEPIEKSPPFLQHIYIATLGGFRIVDSVKQLGTLTLPKN